MTAVPEPARPVYLDGSRGAVFAAFHRPADGSASPTAVIICPPWGWDEVASYRARRAWADALAAAGHPTLRLDLPAAGDSAGTPDMADLLGAWTDAIDRAVAWLLTSPGVERVAAIGLGLGGLVTAKAVADGARIDDLVLWGNPANGRAFHREQRAFAALESTRLGLADDATRDLPEGWLEVGGFVLSSETIAAIGWLDLEAMSPGRLERALLLGRDGMAADRDLAAHLVDGGVDVTVTTGTGWTDMVFHPERYVPPLDTFALVADWLERAPGRPSSEVPSAGPSASGQLDLAIDGVAIRETPIRIDRPFGRIFGVLGAPADPPASGLCAVFLNAGAVRRIGPNRLWVETSRHWNAHGVPTIRMDLEGIGEADGDPARYVDVGNFYTDEFGAQVGAILDDLEDRGFGPRFVLIGLCAGGYWAFHTAAADPRVVEAIIVNPRAMIWDPGLLERREAQKVTRLLEPALWDRIIHGQVGPSRMASVAKAVARTAAGAAVTRARRVRTAGPARPETDPIDELLDALRDLGTRVVLAFSDDEPVFDELAADGILARLGHWPNVILEHLPGRDHTLRPIVAQRAFHRLLDAELDRMTDAVP